MADNRSDDETTGTLRPAPGARRPTMVEVALEAGVSQTTVSLVLNDVRAARFSEETRRRVAEAAAKLGYEVAPKRAPRGGAQGVIALVVDEMSTDPWMALALDGIRDKAWEHGLVVSAAATGGDGAVETAVLRQVAGGPLAGLVYGTINTRRVEPPLVPPGVPVVLLNCYVSDHSLPSIVPAEVVGGLRATRKLIEAGHRRVAFINGEPWMDASRDRLKGYKRALGNAEIEFDADLVRAGNWEPSSGYEQTQLLMALPEPPTAIFCGNDLMALGCYDALKELGKAIPRDVAVVGYDDREMARYLHPPLTTVLLPHYQMGIEAATTLIDLAARPGSHAGQIKIEGELVERGSV